MRDDGGHRGGLCGLSFLSAKATAHAFARADHVIERDANHFGDDHLDFGGMLGGRVNVHGAALSGDGESGMGFEIKVILSADIERSFDSF
jgi:hypothetical protein